LQADLLFRWFVDLPLEAAVFDASTYSKNQRRLLGHEVAEHAFSLPLTRFI
jgi:transposase